MKENVMQLARKCISDYPHLKDDVTEFIQLANEEIENGESPDNEWRLAYSSIQDLIDNEKNNSNETVD